MGSARKRSGRGSTVINAFGNYSTAEREHNDYYATHPSAVYPLFDVEKFTPTVLEPACGEGHMARAISECGYEGVSSDIADRGFGEVSDFFVLRHTPYDIITNPPYKLQSEFVEHAMEVLRPGGKLALFLKIQFLESAKRRELFAKYPPARIYVFSKRARTAKNGDFSSIGSALACFAWFVWERGYAGKPEVDWIEPKEVGR